MVRNSHWCGLVTDLLVSIIHGPLITPSLTSELCPFQQRKLVVFLVIVKERDGVLRAVIGISSRAAKYALPQRLQVFHLSTERWYLFWCAEAQVSVFVQVARKGAIVVTVLVYRRWKRSALPSSPRNKPQRWG